MGGTLTVTRREEDPEKEDPTDNNGEPPHDVEVSVEEDTEIEVPRERSPVPTTIIPLGGTGDSLTQVGGVTQLTPPQIPTDITLSIPGSTLFDLDSAIVRSEAKSDIKDLVDALATLAEGTQIPFNNVITVTGYTDPLGPWSVNQPLSERRAGAVMDVIVARVGELSNEYLTQPKTPENTVGKGEADCTCAAGIDINNEAQVDERIRKYPRCGETTREHYESDYLQSSQAQDKNTEFAPCRRVEISITLPEIPVDKLGRFGLHNISDISATEFIQKINQATTGTE